MNSEECRLRTFQEWPTNSPVSPERLAKAGFYYTGQAQAVQCFFCFTTLTEWNYGDQVMARHRLANPECPFVLDPAATCNVPIVNSNNAAVPNPNDNNNSNQDSNAQTTDMKVYANRLSSFQNWPIPAIISPERLARSGFYYLQLADMVECVYCQGVILKWEPGDDPDREHRTHFPNCDFHLRQETDEDLSAERVELGNVKLMPGTTSSFAELGIQHHSAPGQPRHATYDGRLRTFQGWPSSVRQTPEMLADAGFYYVGVEDQVRCFHCDGGLRNWEETDEAWTEHAKWFPRCGYVNLIKGQDFVKQCVELRPSVDNEIADNVSNDSGENSATSAVSPANSPLQRMNRRVTDAELEGLLGTPPAMQTALEVGLHVGRVKMALKRRMEETGVPYANADELIEDASDIQSGEEDNINMTGRQAHDSPSEELTHLLNQITTTSEAAGSSSTPTERILNSERRNRPVRRRRRPPPSEDEKDEKTASLEDENRRLREARQCKICMDREVAIVFLPCGHLSTCVFCAPSLTHCPMCRHEIRATVRTFFA